MALALAAAATLTAAGEVEAAKDRHAHHRGPSCRQLAEEGGEVGAPTPLSTPLDPRVIAMYGVLRRPATPQDSPPPINSFADDLTFQMRGYYAEFIRRVKTAPDGTGDYLVAGLPVGIKLPPARCLPKELRRRRAHLEAEERVYEREPIYCILSTPHGRRSPFGFADLGSDCEQFSEVNKGTSFFGHATSRTEVLQLVPDGVATVRIDYRSGTVIDAPVANNTFAYTPPQGPIKRGLALVKHLSREFGEGHRRSKREEARLERAAYKRLKRMLISLNPKRVEWLGAGGETLRTIKPQPESAASISDQAAAEAIVIGLLS